MTGPWAGIGSGPEQWTESSETPPPYPFNVRQSDIICSDDLPPGLPSPAPQHLSPKLTHGSSAFQDVIGTIWSFSSLG